MLVVETIGKIRRAFFRQGKSIKAICRELGISRKVVRKVIRSGATEFHYEREEQPLPKIGRWRDTLDQLLLANEAKAARERLTLIRLFEELRGRGYDGGYDAVRRYARRWAKEHGAATASVYVPLTSRQVKPTSSTRSRRSRPAERRDGDREGRPHPALPQPDAVRTGLSARDPGDGVRRPRPGVRPVQGHLHPGHLRQHEDGGGDSSANIGHRLRTAGLVGFACADLPTSIA